ncbi:MAG TPA: GNAT family N-acetyltransferase [Thermoanaerobaculia bacterium]|nr:GNAT family N-acetyltransferase [Thermoanaerobaculia bacterium]
MATIRKAEPRDMAAVGRLGAMLIQTHYAFDTKRFLAPMPGAERGYAAYLTSLLDSKDDCIFVADREGEIVGYVWADLEPMSWKELRGPAGFVQDLLVVDAARRRGIATELLNAAMDWLREHGAPRIMLWTAAPNDAARALFRRVGFRETMIEMTRE